MYYIHAALLLHSAGQSITETKISKILKAAGVEVDNTQIKSLITALDGVDIDEALKSTPMFTTTSAAAPTAAASSKVDEKPEEEEEEEEDLGLTSLFG
ncbi:MAG: 50S ribosomal protein P1 [Promethearchaeota archaeon]